MAQHERELRPKLLEFIYEQEACKEKQKDLGVLQVFLEEYEKQMDVEHLLMIQYLYDSAGFFHIA